MVARDEKRGVYKHLLTGVSFMLPMVVAGGLLIALSLAFGIDAYKQPGSLAAVLRSVGDTAFVLMVPMLAGYIAYSIADARAWRRACSAACSPGPSAPGSSAG